MSDTRIIEIDGWTISNVSLEEYKNYSSRMTNAFNKAEFIELNLEKVTATHCLVIKKGNSERFVVSFGEKEDSLFCPFSASFGYIEEIKPGQTIEYYELAIRLINRYIDENVFRTTETVLPPIFYDSDNLSTWIYLFHLNGWVISNMDIGFAMEINDLYENYEQKIAHNARKNFHIAMKQDFVLNICNTVEEKKMAYDIIRINRETKGYDLKMSKEQVLDTMEIIKSDMFIVSDKSDEHYAAALVYEVAPQIGLVVYWGDIPGYEEKKVMNYLPYALIQEYKKKGFKYLDIGPSTWEGRPNYGLCNYKDSIGCFRYDKYIFSRQT